MLQPWARCDKIHCVNVIAYFAIRSEEHRKIYHEKILIETLPKYYHVRIWQCVTSDGRLIELGREDQECMKIYLEKGVFKAE